mmetsp:Transcript_18881/g.35389  ORF Transcript_18881/g.35389 Transcript_18881/m.35389 type:complete len:91 (+) Transcript_18881:169-441(+)
MPPWTTRSFQQLMQGFLLVHTQSMKELSASAPNAKAYAADIPKKPCWTRKLSAAVNLQSFPGRPHEQLSSQGTRQAHTCNPVQCCKAGSA